jgi:class 3 adenylate cyclase
MTTAPDHSARARLDAAFAAEERRGLMLASAARSAAALVVVAWLAVVNPERGPAYAWVLGTAARPLLATFGVPDVGPRDATDTLACARGMLAALKGWNEERAARGLATMRMGLGLHYGPVVAGDIGSQRSMAFATVGDTTNVTSRLQSLTRDLGATIVVSAALVEAVRREGADLAMLDGLKPQGPHVLRGRETPIDLWTA